MKSSLLLIIFLPLVSFSQRYYQFDSVFNALQATGGFSGSVLIAENGKPLYAKSFGITNADDSSLNNLNTLFLLGSVTKQFTAFAVLQLKINPDDSVRIYLPELPYNGITIRQLLNHTSGIPDYISLMDRYWDKTKYATNTDMLETLVKYHPDPRFSPGLKYEYSNTGYALLALVIEKVSHMSYQQYMEEKIFMPLGMKRTIVYCRRKHPRTVSNYAYGYVFNDSLQQYILPDKDPKWKNGLWEDGIVGEDGINSTVSDLLIWDQALYKTRSDMFAPGKVEQGQTDYGFGWHIKQLPVYGRIAFHGGGWPGYIAYIERHMDNNKTIIVLRNKFTPQIHLPVDDLRNILYAGKD